MHELAYCTYKDENEITSDDCLMVVSNGRPFRMKLPFERINYMLEKQDEKIEALTKQVEQLTKKVQVLQRAELSWQNVHRLDDDYCFVIVAVLNNIENIFNDGTCSLLIADNGRKFMLMSESVCGQGYSLIASSKDIEQLKKQGLQLCREKGGE